MQTSYANDLIKQKDNHMLRLMMIISYQLSI